MFPLEQPSLNPRIRGQLGAPGNIIRAAIRSTFNGDSEEPRVYQKPLYTFDEKGGPARG